MRIPTGRVGRRTRCALAAITLAGAGTASLLGRGAVANATGQTNRRAGTVGVIGREAAAAGATVHYYTLAASAFAPDGLHNTTLDYFNQWDPTTLSNRDGGRCFNAAVNLPNAAKVSSVTFYYTEGSVALFAELSRQDLVNQVPAWLVSWTSPTSATPTYTSTVVAVTANQQVTIKDGYTMGVCPSGNTTFSGATIAYTG